MRHTPSQGASDSHAIEKPSGEQPRWLTYLRRLDLRAVLIGSLLSDIIDKPVGQVLFRETISSGRIFSHTLLFLIVFTLTAVYLQKRQGAIWLWAMSLGIASHLALDKMWRAPRVLLWPIYGITFEREDLTYWLPNILQGLVENPGVYIPELVGAAVLVYLLIRLLRQRKLGYFLRYGLVR